ncbi:MAG: protein kinase [Rubripirellula sp.]
MSSNQTLCQPTFVPACLQDALLEHQQNDFESHLENCEKCRDSLESSAAEKDTWEFAHRFLQDDEDDLQKLADEATGVMGSSQVLIDALTPTDDPRMLGRLGPYEIAGVIGSGGMGVVLKAFDPALSRFVAIKVLAPHSWQDHDARERFSREARAAASIVHENVIEIYGVSETNGIPFFTMPYLRGETLGQRICQRGPLEQNEILRIAKQLADGLNAAHVQGLVHRDIKPENVLLTDGAERVRLSDFGLAHSKLDDRITHTGVLAGTPAFMSPEQVAGESLDQRSDLFSLGSVIYTMCCGRPPFQAESIMQQLMKVSEARQPRLEEVNPTVPTWLAAIVDRLLSLDPGDRYQSATELKNDLEKCLAHSQNPQHHLIPQTVVRLQQRYERAAKPTPLKSIWMGGIGLVTACLIGWLSFHAVGMLLANANAQTVAVRGRVVDQDGKPIAGARVLAVQKTWPGGRYRQGYKETKTDEQGTFRFGKFAVFGSKYAFLLTALPDGHSMTSVYRLVKDGSVQDPVELKVESSRPITVTIKDPNGKPLPDIKVLPHQRTTGTGNVHMTYTLQVVRSGEKTDQNGQLKLSAFQSGDKCKLTLDAGGKVSGHEFQINDDPNVSITMEAPVPEKPAGPPISVKARVIDSNDQPVAGAKVIVVRKTWPNNFYHQDGFEGITDNSGNVSFDEFAPANKQYCFLLTVAHDGYAMISEYQIVEDGSQQKPVVLKLDTADPVEFTLKDSSQMPVKGAVLAPSERTIGSDEYMNYHLNMKAFNKTTDENGTATFTLWKPGDSGKLYCELGSETEELSFKVDSSKRVQLVLP